jgi:hypothetical protein
MAVLGGVAKGPRRPAADRGAHGAGRADWCPTGAGNARLFAFARNGEGLIPAGSYESCLGTGQAAGANLL